MEIKTKFEIGEKVFAIINDRKPCKSCGHYTKNCYMIASSYFKHNKLEISNIEINIDEDKEIDVQYDLHNGYVNDFGGNDKIHDIREENIFSTEEEALLALAKLNKGK